MKKIEKVVQSLDKFVESIEELKAALLEEETSDVEETTSKKTKAAKAETPKKEKTTAKKPATKAKAEDDDVDDDEDEVDYSGMKYNDLKKLAVKKGLKKPNVTREEIVAFLTGEELDEDDGEDEEEDIEDGKDLTAEVEELLKDVETEDIAEFLAENGISAKGKRPSIIAKVVDAIESGDISIDDIVPEDDEDEEEAPPAKKEKTTAKKPAKETSAKKSSKKEEDDSSDLEGYVKNKKGGYENEDEENPILAKITPARYKAYLAEKAAFEKAFKAKKITTKTMITELKSFHTMEELDIDELDKDEVVTEYLLMKLCLIDDDGESNPLEEAYEVNGTTACCGHELDETEDGYICHVCETEYDAE